ncbi:MAG: class II aldolase/adducin family protein [Sinobacteraceae bacterium]|nr:class II aldolase/adducin family protein [Nevskiaceae bacterium]
MCAARLQALVDTAHELAAAGLVPGTAGNLSLRDGERVWITASGARFDVLEAQQITAIALGDGHALEGAFKPSSEYALHLAIYQHRPEAGAVVHTHAPWATALACVLDELPCIHYQMLPLGGAVRVAPYRCFGTAELAQVTLEALQDRRAVLMSNHGATTLAEDLPTAVAAMQVLESSCRMYWRAAQLGTPRTLSAQQWQEVAEQVRRLDYGTPHALSDKTHAPNN